MGISAFRIYSRACYGFPLFAFEELQLDFQPLYFFQRSELGGEFEDISMNGVLGKGNGAKDLFVVRSEFSPENFQSAKATNAESP